MHDPSFRAIARCPRCELTQYRPDHGRCRRCGWSLPRGSSHFAIRMPGFANAIEQASPQPAVRLGALLRHMRQDRGLSQRQLARAIGSADHSQISRLESGTGDPRLSTITRLLTALGCDWSPLFPWLPRPARPDASSPSSPPHDPI